MKTGPRPVPAYSAAQAGSWLRGEEQRGAAGSGLQLESRKLGRPACASDPSGCSVWVEASVGPGHRSREGLCWWCQV